MKNVAHLSCIICFVFCSLTVTKLSAQDDFIIDVNGTKIVGQANRVEFEKVKFKPLTEQKKIKFKPSELREIFRKKDGLFRSVYVPDKKKQLFLKVLEDGKIRLYEYYKNTKGWGYFGAGPNPMPNASSVDKNWYAEKNGELVEIKTNSWFGSRKARKERFREFIKDNEKILQRYESEQKYSFDFIRLLIADYNSYN